MRTRTVKALWAISIVTALMVAVATFPAPALTQGTSADNMQILREKIKADKKLLVATNMDLTESEAKGFWPVYEEYQKDLTAINQRIGKLIESYVPKLSQVLPQKKVARYLQIENKIRAVVKYELAGAVPLVQ
jgi:hypothetical protein